ncbi:MAG TPA: hypothetical protein ENI69_01575, partial [Rhodospirillales bacterium]|nr:hypothetical protein [Rhodospirillales bacterium]
PGDVQLTEYHSNNADRFTAPEFRKITYISLTADDLAKEIAISDDTIAESYAARMNEYLSPENRVLQQIRVKDEAVAKKAYDRLKGGGDFATVAREVAGLDPDQINLGAMTRSQLLPELADPVFALQPGQFTAPLKSLLGWHIIRLDSITAPVQKSLADIKENLVKELASDKAIDSLYRVANSLEDELGGGATFEEAARALNLPIRTIPMIDRSGTANGVPVADLPKGDFLSVAFETIEGQDSPLTESGGDGYFIIRIDSVTAPELRPLASIRADVLSAWQQDQRAENGKKMAQDIIAKIKSGENMATLAKDLGLKISNTEPFTRRESVGSLSPSLVTALFAASPGDTLEAVGNGGHVVARLKDVKAANPVARKKDLDALGQSLTSAMRADLLGQLSGGLRQTYPVSINAASLDALF